MYDKLNLHSLQFPNLEFMGYNETIRINQLKNIYNMDQIELMSTYFMNSPFLTHIFTNKMLRSKESFSKELENSVKDMPEFKRVRRMFDYKVNKTFSNPRVGYLLDSGEIDFTILHVLRTFAMANGKYI